MRVGIVSDTHGKLHPEMLRHFRDVDHILHAGDIGGESILEALRELAPVTAVAGNIDGFHCGDAGEFARVTLGGRAFLLTHILPRPRNPAASVRAELARERGDVVVFGHSHLPHSEVVDGVHYFNPASAGPRRFDYPVAIGMFEKRGKVWRSRHLALDERSHEALARTMNQLSR